MCVHSKRRVSTHVHVAVKRDKRNFGVRSTKLRQFFCEEYLRWHAKNNSREKAVLNITEIFKKRSSLHTDSN